MGQFGAQQVGDGNQILGAEVAMCLGLGLGLGLGGLDQAVEALDIAVGKPGVEAPEDAGMMRLQGVGQAFEGLQAAAARPTVPTIQRDVGVSPCSGC